MDTDSSLTIPFAMTNLNTITVSSNLAINFYNSLNDLNITTSSLPDYDPLNHSYKT